MNNFKAKYIYLPLSYFFFLSVGLLLMCMYLLTTEHKQGNVSYAQTEEIETKLSSDSNTTALEKSEQFVDKTALQIDEFFTSRNAPLGSYGRVFTEEARKNQIDPTLVAAIAWCESNGGKVTPQFGGKESYNAWGYAVFDSNNTTRAMNAYDMQSWENGIAILSRAMRKNYDRGLIEPEEIVTRYTPASVEKANGDPTQAPWTLCVKKTMDNIINLTIAD